MKASEAKEIANKRQDVDLKNVLAAIKQAANEGKFVLSYRLKGDELTFCPRLSQKLKELGYTVKRDTYIDIRSPQEDYESLTIDWN